MHSAAESRKRAADLGSVWDAPRTDSSSKTDENGDSLYGLADGTERPRSRRDFSIAMNQAYSKAKKLEQDGRLIEAMRHYECALILRHSFEREKNDPEGQPQDQEVANISPSSTTPTTLFEQTKEFVLRCNTCAVAEFNDRHFDAASYFLDKALALTHSLREEVKGESTNATDESKSVGEKGEIEKNPNDVAFFNEAKALEEEERKRLRAATWNNLGCMERRRGDLQSSLRYLKKAARMEGKILKSSSETPLHTQGSPSTFLNLCTVLNELKMHKEAVGAAQSAVHCLHVREQVDGSLDANDAMMLVVGLYNLGVSLEKLNTPADIRSAAKAYQEALDTSRRCLGDNNCPTVEAAMQAILRVKGSSTSRSSDSNPSKSLEQCEESIKEKNKSVADKKSSLPSNSANTSTPQAPLTVSEATPPTDYSKNIVASSVNQPQVGSTLPPVPFTNRLTPNSAISSFPRKNDILTGKGGLGNASTAATVTEGMYHVNSAPGGMPVRDSSSLDPRRASLDRPQGPLRQSTLQPMRPMLNHNDRPQQLPPIGATSLATSVRTDLFGVNTKPPLPDQKEKDLLSAQSRQSSVPFSQKELTNFPLGPTSTSPSLTASAQRISISNSLQRFGEGNARPIGAGSLPSGPLLDGARRPSKASNSNDSHRLSRASISPGANGKKNSMMDKEKRRREKMKLDQMKKQKKEQAERDAELADRLYDEVVTGMKHKELVCCNESAIKIQRVWRGVMARTYIRLLIESARVIQRHVRKFLVKVRIINRRQEEIRAKMLEAKRKKELEAVLVLQRHTRQFLRRLEIIREHRSRKARRFYAARVIQRAYRSYRIRQDEYYATLAEKQRREDRLLYLRQSIAARTIQRTYLEFKERKREKNAQLERERRSRAAISIQALVRGMLTRAWFGYYKAYCRDQELRSAASQQRIAIIQAGARGLLSNRLCWLRQLDILTAMREKQLRDAALKIQCMWRCRVARIHYERLYIEWKNRCRHASNIQRWYRARRVHHAYLVMRDNHRREKAAIAIQRWYEACKVRRKERDFARYHAELARKRRLAQLQKESILLLQGWLTARSSQFMVCSMRSSYMKCYYVACYLQRIARGFADRKELNLLRLCVLRTKADEEEHRRRTAAALIIQRAYRCAAAKDAVEKLRRRHAAARIVTANFRIYLAKKQLWALRDKRRLEIEERAVTKLQKWARSNANKKRLREMEEYYRTFHQRKMILLRRNEAATMIQSLWRGYATRQAIERDKVIYNELSVFASKIQRTWRSRRFRNKLEQAIEVGNKRRDGYKPAVLKIQCFWRKMLAAEKTARRRAELKRQSLNATKIQCWWRVLYAKKYLVKLRETRKEEQALELLYMQKWERSATVINSFLRARKQQCDYLVDRREMLINLLSFRDKERYRKRIRAASRIQALYRGHCERVYVRTLLREKRAEEERERIRESKKLAAALVIQCAFRRYKATKLVRQMLTEKRARILEEQERYYTTADPKDIVKELFWAHEAVIKRNLQAERNARRILQDKAAVKIQAAIRRWICLRDYAKRLAERRRDLAAEKIGKTWQMYKKLKRRAVEAKQEAAAVLVQSHVRGFLARRRWAEWKRVATEEKQLLVLAEDIFDQAATRVQAVWRRFMVQRKVQKIKHEKRLEREEKAANEAASIIQRAYRKYRQRKRTRLGKPRHI